ncbi:MAG: DUF438 domain-containing protein [Atopostipes suicloacalis]|nr:DUF438 domain-containing protein [Atopostipes suicloacalis]
MTDLLESKRERQNKLKELILRLHEGESEDTITKEFAKHFQNISPLEISVMERRLMKEEGLSVDEIMRLCNVHVAVMANHVENESKLPNDFEKPGHPVHVLKEENLALEANLMRIGNLLETYLSEGDKDEEIKKGLEIQIDFLAEFDYHYKRKEHSIFPLMEKYEILAPPKVMWGVDDEIRDLYYQFKNSFFGNHYQRLEKQFDELEYEMQEMFVKEEEIMIPMISEVFNIDDWLKIRDESKEIGYCLVEPLAEWEVEKIEIKENLSEEIKGEMQLGTGYLTKKELDLILNLLPLELTFIDKDDVVKYFNNQEGPKLLPRTPNAIGRDVMNCHPPKSYRIVEQLIKDLKTGKKDQEVAWFKKGTDYVHITYVAVRDEAGEYLGILEYVQDITELVKIDGEKRVK